MTFQPTDQQKIAADLFVVGDPLRISAYAGTGKTSTLAYLSNVSKRRGLYLAFNKSIADDAKRRFATSVTCMTTHAMAFRALRGIYSVERMTQNFNAGTLVQTLGLKSLQVEYGVSLSPRAHGALVAETLRRFMRSGDERMGLWCVPLEGRLGGLSPDVKKSVQARVMETAWRYWQMVVDTKAAVPMSHDGYLKAWALTKPEFGNGFVMLDEAQDTNGVVMELVRSARGQLVCVGDAHQSIYEWRGAENAMVELPCKAEARLSKSWRFGSVIAANASRYLALLGERVPLTGNDARRSVIGPVDRPDAILARTNARLIEVLLSALERGERPFVVGGVSELLAFLDAAERLMAGQPVDRPLELFGFASWTQVEEASEQEGGEDLRRMVSMINKYGISALRSALERLPRHENDATVLLSTGHKAKGREWRTVRLEDDFLRGVPAELKKMEHPSTYAAELRLLYVAATRGMEGLEIPESLQERISGLESVMRAEAA